MALASVWLKVNGGTMVFCTSPSPFSTVSMYFSRSMARLRACRIAGLAAGPSAVAGPKLKEAVEGPTMRLPAPSPSKAPREPGGTLKAPSISPSVSAVVSVEPSVTKTYLSFCTSGAPPQ